MIVIFAGPRAYRVPGCRPGEDDVRVPV